MAKKWGMGSTIHYAGGGARTPSVVDTGTESSGIGAQLMARAELNPQYEADKAATDVQNKAQAQMGAENRRLSAMGISPGAGRSMARNRNAGIALAAAKSGAANKGRRNALEDNWNRMATAAGFVRSDQNRSDRLKQQAINNANTASSGGTNIRAGGRTQAQRRAESGGGGYGKTGGGSMYATFARSGGDKPAHIDPKTKKRVAATGVYRSTSGSKWSPSQRKASQQTRVANQQGSSTFNTATPYTGPRTQRPGSNVSGRYSAGVKTGSSARNAIAQNWENQNPLY